MAYGTVFCSKLLNWGFGRRESFEVPVPMGACAGFVTDSYIVQPPWSR